MSTFNIAGVPTALTYCTQLNFADVDSKSIVAIEQPSQNGQTRPIPNTKTGLVWDICDYLYNKRQSEGAALPVPVISEVIEIYEGKVFDAKGPTARQQFGFWLKFYGLEAMRDERVKTEGSAEDEAAKAAKAEKERIKAEKAAEKQKIADAKELEKLQKIASKSDAEIDAEEKRIAAKQAALAKIKADRAIAVQALADKAAAEQAAALAAQTTEQPQADTTGGNRRGKAA